MNHSVLSILFFLLVVSLLRPIFLHAQKIETVVIPNSKTLVYTPYLRFDPVHINDSLLIPSKHPFMALQDSRGYMWFKTRDGELSRYDGKYYRPFKEYKFGNQAETPTGLVVAATDRGLAVFDTLTSTFTHYPMEMEETVMVSAPIVHRNKVYLTAGTPRAGTRSLLFEFDLNTRTFTRKNPTKIINGFTGDLEPTETISMLFSASSKTKERLWGYIETKGEACLGYYDILKNLFVWYPLEDAVCAEFVGQKRPDQSLPFSSVHIEGDDRYIWASGWPPTGFLRLDTKNSTWKQYYFATQDLNRIYKVLPYDKDKLLFQSDYGLSLFDKKQETVHLYPHIADDPYSPPIKPTPYLTSSKQGFWFGNGADNSFSILNSSRQYFRKIPRKMTRKNGVLIIGKIDSKLYYSYKENEKYEVAEYDEESKNERIIVSERDNRIRIFGINHVYLNSSDSSFWFSGSLPTGSMFRWDRKKDKVTFLNEKIDGLPFGTNDIAEQTGMVEDLRGNLWFSTIGMKSTQHNVTHLVCYNSKEKKFKGFAEGTVGLPIFHKPLTLLCDRRGIIWMGYQSSGNITWFDPITEKAETKSNIDHFDKTRPSMVNKLLEDKKRDLIWISAYNEGLWKYDFKSDIWAQVLQETITRTHLSEDGKIWYRSPSALVCYDPDTGKKTEFGKAYGFTGLFSYPFTQTPDGEFFFGDFRFFSEGVQPQSLKPNIVFSFLKVFEQEISESAQLNYLKNVVLRYDQNFFSVGFSILNPLHNELDTYSYKLEGFSEDWVSIGNSSLAVFTNVPPGSYTLLVKGANSEGIWSDIKSIKLIVTPPYWQTWWFRTFMFLFAIGVAYAIYRYRLNQLTLKSRLEAETARYKQKEAELSRLVAETEIAALRAQMNPHFIFNCLNSIQYYTANNQANVASDYLSKFSRLIRLVLESSKNEKITLEKELETLRLYLEMEIMRFGDKVKYKIDVSQEVETEAIEIPPLLIQPFIENAVWHGLMHKEIGGTILVEVHQLNFDVLYISIKDDGIGRERAAQLKSKSATQRKSFGIKITEDRIRLIHELYQTKTTVTVLDLKDTEGNTTGTQVILEIQI